MNRLPIEVLEIIFDKILWDNPGELYRLRAVSHLWKSVAERSGSRVFKYWYNRCKEEIPEDHLVDIVQAKYPLVAHPWREFYWVDCRLPHVAKNVYNIWKNFLNLDEGINDSKSYYPLRTTPWNPTVAMNDKYFATSYSYDIHDELVGTQIYRWDKLDDLPIRKFDFVSDQIDFYTTEKGAFIVLAQYNRINDDFEIYISKYPIDKNPDFPPDLILLGRVEKYFITQNECFWITGSTYSRLIEHKIITDGGFQTNTSIKLPAEMPQLSWTWIRVEICGCILYVVQKGDGKFSIAKYKISRNFAGKLSFTFEELQILNRDDDQGYNGALYSQLDHLVHVDICSENLHLTDLAFTSARLNPWISRVSRISSVHAKAVHANYVFCTEHIFGAANYISIIQRDNLIERMAADDPDDLERVSVPNFAHELDICEPDINWVSIIYIGLKAKILVQFDYSELALINFY